MFLIVFLIGADVLVPHSQGRQEDAEEYLGFTLNGLHEEMLALKKLISPQEESKHLFTTSSVLKHVTRQIRSSFCSVYSNYTKAGEASVGKFVRFLCLLFRFKLNKNITDQLSNMTSNALHIELMDAITKKSRCDLTNLTFFNSGECLKLQ